MKPSANKTFVVRLTADNIQEFEIDLEVFDDPFMEAATRAVEQSKKMEHGIIRAFTDIWEKKSPKKSITYNSYWVLVNAACYVKAELLREKYKMQRNVDLAKEPLHGDPR